MAVSRDGCVDESWIDLVDRLKVHAVLLECPGDVVLDKNITLGRQLVKDLYARRILERECQGLLIAVCLYPC